MIGLTKERAPGRKGGMGMAWWEWIKETCKTVLDLFVDTTYIFLTAKKGWGTSPTVMENDTIIVDYGSK